LELVRGTSALHGRLVRPVLTIGNFDGVHLGHQSIMRTVISRARGLDGQSVVLTFDPHPRKVVQPDRAPLLLTTTEQKLEALEAIGIDVVIVEPFDREFASVTPDYFVREIVHARIAPEEVFVGYDFHFGRDREGSMRTLCETGANLGFSVTIIPEVKVGNQDVNSTRIRSLLAAGEVDNVETLLGRPFSLRSTVGEGDRRGRTIGFPTANLEPENEILPGVGVYAGEMRILDGGETDPNERYPAVVNVGLRPTFYQEGRLIAEAHLLDFQGDLYGRCVELSFCVRLRSERKFPNVDALKEQIAADVVSARETLLARKQKE
jgi:riboflavin kinase/FMN adenylyltransferase